MLKNDFKYPLFYWHLELSSKCALKCPRCPRNEFPGKYKVTELDLSFIKKLFYPEFLEKFVQKILFCGGQGDPIYCKDFLEIVSYLKTQKPNLNIVITTNGSYKSAPWWNELGSILNEYDEIIFSVDGWDQESNEEYRVNSDFNSIVEGIKSLNQTKATIRWTTILFKFNENKIQEIEDLSSSLGCDYFSLTVSNLFGSFFNAYIDKELGLDPLEPNQISTNFRHKRYLKKLSNKKRKFTNYENQVREQEKIVIDEYSQFNILPHCKIGERALYVDAEGIFYPCSWVSHPFDEKGSLDLNKKIKFEDSYWVKNKDRFNLKERSLEEILNSEELSTLERKWRSEDSSFIECERKCRNKNVQFI